MVQWLPPATKLPQRRNYHRSLFTLYSMTESIAEFLSVNFRAHAEDRAYGQRHGYRMEWFSYGEILAMANWFSEEFKARGIAKGERVMLWGENCAEWVAVFFGCALRGVVVVPMDDGASAEFARRVSQQVEARLWVCSRKHAAKIELSLGTVVILEDIRVPVQMELGRGTLGSSDASTGRGDILQIVFTSGTTAEPKGVVITHDNVLANIAPFQREMRRYLKYERWVHPMRFLSLLPLSHVFGQFLGMFLPPLLGGTVIFQKELKPTEIVGTIRREQVSVLVAVPRVLQSLRQKIEGDLEADGGLQDFHRRFHDARGEHFLRRWWTFRDIHRKFGWKFWALICGGATLDSGLEEFWGRLGYAVVQGYGLTETTSLISVNHPFKLGGGSIGKVLPGREMKLAADGEILIRGAGVSSGYWGANGSAISDEDGWYHTGDIGTLDENGNLYFKGRKKEVIVTAAGLNVYPEDLEAALRRQPEVKDCVVVGIDRESNDEPCAVLILREKASPQDVVDRANGGLADFQRMRIWLQWPEEDFPRTSTQKPRRNVIKEFAEQEILHGGTGTAPKGGSFPLGALIERITGRSVADLNGESRLDADLGLSSLDRVDLIGSLEERYQIDLGETSIEAIRTLEDVEKLLRREAQPRISYHYPAWALRWPSTWLRWFAHYSLVWPAVLVLARPRIEGRENIESLRGPVLVVCNHISDVDIAFVRTILPPYIGNHLATATRGEALEALRQPASDRSYFLAMLDRLKWILGVSLLNLFPLPREASFRESFAYAGRAVDRGYSILVFPEGQHTADGKINTFRAGIGLLAKNLNVPVVPMRIMGLFEMKEANKRVATPGSIRVRIGKPICFAQDITPEQIVNELQAVVEGL